LVETKRRSRVIWRSKPMGGHQVSIELAEANGKAIAALCLQTALIPFLKEKGLLSREDLLSMTGTAVEVLNSLSGVSLEQREMCEALLEGLTSVWISRLSIN
jgi:hypothetical protein